MKKKLLKLETSLYTWSRAKATKSWELLNNERGESRGVGALVWIMITVLIALLIWGLLSGFLQSFWTTITGKISTIN
ncbi:hypothetical protein [Paenibacillus agricola]|uniref:Flagellin-like protein n=1 Tax=Paenibacillus agricola TaxID=2716264 RepID=A0ABX0JL51_9BACL|nr:hypothetical protein [Paenibacillus agricola]NHN34885.1 hypothetical protein [Paenibacillus agricola]NHN34886.1 hypothetical protein [Paenibacillus agricola]